MDKKDLITVSLTIFRYTFGISFWTKSEQKKPEKKKGEMRTAEFGTYEDREEKPAKK